MSKQTEFYITVGETHNDDNQQTILISRETLDAMAKFILVGCLNSEGESKKFAQTIKSVLEGPKVVRGLFG